MHELRFGLAVAAAATSGVGHDDIRLEGGNGCGKICCKRACRERAELLSAVLPQDVMRRDAEDLAHVGVGANDGLGLKENVRTVRRRVAAAEDDELGSALHQGSYRGAEDFGFVVWTCGDEQYPLCAIFHGRSSTICSGVDRISTGRRIMVA